MTTAAHSFPFRVIPLSTEAAAIRAAAGSSGPDSPVAWNDGEPHQCRSCLTLTRPEEACLLASHSPFPLPQPYAERGPLFVHARDCAPYGDDRAFPPDFRALDLVLRAYDRQDRIAGAARVNRRPVETVIAELFADPKVAYLHVRNTTYGCFICRIERG